MQSLENHLLIAMPSLNGSFFDHAVVYVYEHHKHGALGLMINKPLQLTTDALLKQLDITVDSPDTFKSNHVLLGGPVMPKQGYILHSKQKKHWKKTQKITSDIHLTYSDDILMDLGTKNSPDNFLITMGYSGWSPHQLEQEIMDNSWLTLPNDMDFLFHIPLEERWNQAIAKLGFHPNSLSSNVGHA